ncbi:hypothetical protein IIB79_02240 [candidate division KSB1 bacterium]|nr:hypothetical protein [candidate division KSB1 bacterium]
MDNQNPRIPVYREHLLNAAPSLLSHLNRDPYSPTYGSFDREYWSWQSKDFSNTDFQRAVFPLTVLYLHDFEGNLYYNNSRLLTWIAAGLSFWCKIQYKNGSFDQWYPREYSVGTTAFTLGPAIKTFSILGEKLGQFENLKKNLLRSFRRGADFICSQHESHGFISNHRAGMALSLAYSSKVLGGNKYGDKAGTIIKDIMDHQSPEGWFREYGGADPGYESLGISYLAAYYEATKNEAVLKMLKNSVDFYVNFVHPDGTAGGEYGSRNTELFFPAGFEMLRDYYDLIFRTTQLITRLMLLR